MKEYLLSIDLNTTRISKENYFEFIKSFDDKQIEIHIYNCVSPKKYQDVFCGEEIIHPYNGSRKKVALDLTQAFDTIEKCSKNKYKKVFLLCGDFESDMLFAKLSEMNVNFKKLSSLDFRANCNNIAQTQIKQNSEFSAKITYNKPQSTQNITNINNSKIENIDKLQLEKLLKLVKLKQKSLEQKEIV